MATSRKKGNGGARGVPASVQAPSVRAQRSEPSTQPLDDIAPELLKSPALPFPVVCIGASAGGLEAFTQLLEAMPTDTGMAFVLVSHLSPSHASHLAEILSRATPMPVAEVKDEPTVLPNHVYVIPPDRSMVIAQGSLKLLPRRDVRGQHHPIDQFLESLARDQRHQSIAVILSGTGSDGTLGMDEIKGAGGITFAQDGSAAYESMPRSAIAAGAVDFVLAPEGIARRLEEIARHAYVSPVGPPAELPPADVPQFRKLVDLLHQAMGVDFADYRFTTLRRRIARRMALQRVDRLPDYLALLHDNPAEVQALFHDILIGVTSFFRDPETFELLKTRQFPRLFRDRGAGDTVRMWVVGCSTGEEAYSLAIMVAEYMERERRVWPVQIFATDLNGVGLERARAGLYSKSIAERVTTERLRRYFVEVDGQYRVAKTVRDMCIFARHNVAADAPFSRMDLISCRNLLIYLEPELQQHLMPILHYALKPAGLLWLGASETTGPSRALFEPEDDKHRFYVKKPNGGPRFPLLMGHPFSDARAVRAELAATAGRRGADFQSEVDRILLARYTPPGVLVNSDLEILQFRGDTSAYLAPAAGRASLHLLKMLREGLSLPARAAITHAKREREAVRENAVPVKTPAGTHLVDIEVVPVQAPGGAPDCFLVLFHETRKGAAPRVPVARNPSEGEAQLKQELETTKAYLQSVIEQQEAANEELQSANEEVQSANEELQSINEEVETSKEEIQSANEELSTVNDELQSRNAELGQTNNDLTNLIASVQMAIVMLGPDLRIRRFTPMAEKMMHVIPSDVGRRVTDIKLNMDMPDLEQLVHEVVDTVQPVQREVQDRNGRWYSLRVRPYRTLDNRIDGAVIVLVDIDAIKQTEIALRTNEERLRITYDAVPAGMFETDLEGRFVRVNDKFCELTGRARETLLMLRSQDITHPDDVAADLANFDRIRNGAIASIRREKRYLREDGQAIWVEVHRFSVSDPQGNPAFVVGLAEDISERKESETTLRRREAHFRSLMNAAPALIWSSGAEGMDYVNQAYIEFLGVESQEVLGNAWTYFMHPDDRDDYARAYDRASKGLQPFEHQFRFRRGDGEYRWMMSVALPQLGVAGRLAGYTGATFDITSLKAAELSLRTADQRKDEFIAMLAHELRNPLAPITNVVQVLKSGDVDERTGVWAHEVLDRQLRNMTRMVNDLLDVSRISHGKIQLHLERVELSDLVSRSVDALRPTIEAGKKHIAIELPTRQVVLYADPMRLEQVIGNLVHNAVKFTPQNGHIWLTATVDERENRLCFTVRDDGEGIAPEALHRVFDLFMQGSTSLDRAQGGLGIGLTLVRGLVELHGGTVTVHSDGPGTGSEFIVTLPIEEVPARPATLPPPAAGTNGPQRILIVDDNVDAANALAALLRQDGHTIEVANSGAVALDVARSFRPEVALVDLGMPGMNGFDLAGRLRDLLAEVVLVAVSGYSGDESRRRARAAGFDEYFIKPFDPQAFEELMGRHRRRAV